MKMTFLFLLLAILLMAGCGSVNSISIDKTNTNTDEWKTWKTGLMPDGSVRAIGKATMSSPTLAQKVADQRARINALAFILEKNGIKTTENVKDNVIVIGSRIVRREVRGDTWISLAEISSEGVEGVYRLLQKYNEKE
jgi:2-succinyl-5-enolpyruvyl-6-hydroxy-3-cyclohexene-1-carboxylate synthase